MEPTWLVIIGCLLLLIAGKTETDDDDYMADWDDELTESELILGDEQ